MARQVRFHELGGPEVLRIENVNAPEPGAGELRLKVKAIGLNRAEALFRLGHYLESPVLPSRLGYEAAGTVDALGPGVTEFAPGDRVSVIPTFHFADYGTYGDLVLVPARAVVRHPENLSWAEAAATWTQYITAWGSLIDIAKLMKDDVVLISAASSSVGLAAIQITSAVGATPVALTRTSAKAEALRSLGAKHVIATEEELDLVAEVMRITDGKGARVALDPVVGPIFAELVEATAVGGTIIVYGMLGGAARMPVIQMIKRNLAVHGYWLIEMMASDERLTAAKQFILDGLSRGVLRPVIAKEFAFDDIVEAHRYLDSNAQIGKVVVTI
jgi:NADPH:quinone reductase-like Zn-dependent oxidoreductase